MTRYNNDGVLKINSLNDLYRVVTDLKKNTLESVLFPCMEQKDIASRLLSAKDVLLDRLNVLGTALASCYSVNSGIINQEGPADIKELEKFIKINNKSTYDLLQGINKELKSYASIMQAKYGYSVPNIFMADINRIKSQSVQAEWDFIRLDYSNIPDINVQKLKGYSLAYKISVSGAECELPISLSPDYIPTGYVNMSPKDKYKVYNVPDSNEKQSLNTDAYVATQIVIPFISDVTLWIVPQIAMFDVSNKGANYFKKKDSKNLNNSYSTDNVYIHVAKDVNIDSYKAPVNDWEAIECKQGAKKSYSLEYILKSKGIMLNVRN